MGGGCCGMFEEITPEQVVGDELLHLIKWAGYVQTSAESDATCLETDFAEVKDTIRRLNYKMTQLGGGIASRVRRPA